MSYPQLNDLIAYLAPRESIPKDEECKLSLYRSLVNTRKPVPESPAFLQAQDEFLQELVAARGVVDLKSCTPSVTGIYLWRGDITRLRVDAIVNAANSEMLGCFSPCHQCIDNAIHTFSGTRLRNECADIMQRQGHPEPIGGAKLTRGYNLPAVHVIHTVGPIISDSVTPEAEQQLADCYRSCLQLAEASGLSTLAFCCISTGLFRFPAFAAARIATATVKEYFAFGGRLNAVVFDVFRQADLDIYRTLLATP